MTVTNNHNLSNKSSSQFDCSIGKLSFTVSSECVTGAQMRVLEIVTRIQFMENSNKLLESSYRKRKGVSVCLCLSSFNKISPNLDQVISNAAQSCFSCGCGAFEYFQ